MSTPQADAGWLALTPAGALQAFAQRQPDETAQTLQALLGTSQALTQLAWFAAAPAACGLFEQALAKGWVEREHSKTDRRRVHVIVTDKGFQDLEIKRREFEDRTAAFLEQLGETDTQEMVRLLRRANEIIDRNQEGRDTE